MTLPSVQAGTAAVLRAVADDLDQRAGTEAGYLAHWRAVGTFDAALIAGARLQLLLELVHIYRTQAIRHEQQQREVTGD